MEIQLERRRILAAMFLAGAAAKAGSAQRTTPRPPDRIALGEEGIQQLLLLMSLDKNCKISKQEFLRLMEAEFDRMDTD